LNVPGIEWATEVGVLHRPSDPKECEDERITQKVEVDPDRAGTALLINMRRQPGELDGIAHLDGRGCVPVFGATPPIARAEEDRLEGTVGAPRREP
jgi:hypothetical protein